MTASLLRKLFLDANPLVDQVNKKYKIKLRFTINDRKPPAMKGLAFWSMQDGFDPETAHFSIPLQVNKEKMLNNKS